MAGGSTMPVSQSPARPTAAQMAEGSGSLCDRSGLARLPGASPEDAGDHHQLGGAHQLCSPPRDSDVLLDSQNGAASRAFRS